MRTMGRPETTMERIRREKQEAEAERIVFVKGLIKQRAERVLFALTVAGVMVGGIILYGFFAPLKP